MEQASGFSCPRCGTEYQLPASRVGSAGRIGQCAKCNHSFLLRPASIPPPQQDTLSGEEPGEQADSVLEPTPPEDVSEAEELSILTQPREAQLEGAEADSEPGLDPGDETSGEPLEVDEEPAPAMTAEEMSGDAGDAIEEGEALEIDTDSEWSLEEPPEEPAETEGEGIEVGDSDSPWEVESAAPGEEAPETATEKEADDSEIEDTVRTTALDPEATDTVISKERQIPTDIEMPDTDTIRRGVVDFEDVEIPEETPIFTDGEESKQSELQPTATKSAPSKHDPAQQVRELLGKKLKRAQTFSRGRTGTPETSASGIIYKVIIVLIGLGGLSTAVLDLKPWQLDPIWSITIIAVGALSFAMQNLSGLLMAGLFSFFYPLTSFSRQLDSISSGSFNGLVLIGAQTALAIIFLLLYALLMNRKRALFVLKEGSGQSIASLLFGLTSIALAVFAHLQPSSSMSLNALNITGQTLGSISYYGGVAVPVLLQACFLSLAIAFGFSARTVRNRMLPLANAGITLGFLVLILLYLPLVVGEIILSLPW